MKADRQRAFAEMESCIQLLLDKIGDGELSQMVRNEKKTSKKIEMISKFLKKYA